MTELQVGSFIFMDVDYRRIGGASGPVFDEFGPALTVLATNPVPVREIVRVDQVGPGDRRRTEHVDAPLLT